MRIPCLRWAGFRGDVFLTDDSYCWLENWMEEHRIPRSPSEQMEDGDTGLREADVHRDVTKR